MTDQQNSSIQLKVFTSPAQRIGATDRTFSPVTSTLIYGERNAVLVDAQFFEDDVDALGDMVEKTDKKLTDIFITHGHSDHYFGSSRLAAQFPGARIVATPSVVKYISSHHDNEKKTFLALFGEDVVLPTSFPSPLDDEFVLLEGHKLRVIEVGQGDIAPTAVLHVPALDAVVTGDVTYNEIHQMLGLGGPAEWEKWIASIDAIERLRPRFVVAGHKKPEARDDDVTKILDGTRAYIRDFTMVAGSKGSAQEIVETMQARYPNHGNLTTLAYSARETIKRRS